MCNVGRIKLDALRIVVLACGLALFVNVEAEQTNSVEPTIEVLGAPGYELTESDVETVLSIATRLGIERISRIEVQNLDHRAVQELGRPTFQVDE